MKKTILIIFQLLLTVTIFAQTYRYASTNLNLRSGPGSSYLVLSTIPSGTSVEIAESCDCAWIKIYYNEKIGYVSSKYLVKSQSTHSNQNTTIKYYHNSSKQKIQSPTYYNSQPVGATALCRDGTYSFSRSRRGTCSHHGGVATWLR